MPIRELKLNIDGELVDLRDTKKIVEILTKPQRNKIEILKKDLVSISEERIAVKKFEDLAKRLKSACESLNCVDLSGSIFDHKAPSPVGLSPSDFLTFLDVKVQPSSQAYPSPIAVQPIQMALAERWQSPNFASKLGSVVKATGANCFQPGQLRILIQNNAISSTNSFTSPSENLISAGLRVGSFFINDNSITIKADDSLSTLVDRINNLSVGVQASIEPQNPNGYKVILRSSKIGIENAIRIDDPNNIISDSLGFSSHQDYETVTLVEGDTLNQVAHKINAYEKNTNLHANVFQTSGNNYALRLQSMSPGLGNAFQFADTAKSGSPQTATVLGVNFNVTQQAQDAVIMVDGSQISSPINFVKVYDDVEIIMKASSTNTFTFEINSDHNAIFTAVNNFVEKYNAFKKLYDDDNKSINNKPSGALHENARISNAIKRIENAINVMAELDIGIATDTIELDKAIDDKTVKQEYKNMLVVDKLKLFDTITDHPEKVQEAFDTIIDSSSSSFSKPIIFKKIGLDNQALGTNKIDLDIDIDATKIKVISRASLNFPKISNVVNINDRSQFKPGVFWLNGAPVTISSGMSMKQVVEAINGVSNLSRISAAAGQDYIELVKYAGAYTAADDDFKFQNLCFFDPNDVCQDVFAVKTTAEFDHLTLTGQASITVNGTTVSLQAEDISSAAKFAQAINNLSSQTGVSAKVIQKAGQTSIEFNTNKLQDIVIGVTNVDGFAGTTMLSQQNGKALFDTSKAIRSDVQINGVKCNKSCMYTIYGTDLTSGGQISILNHDDKSKLENVELYFLGGSDRSHILIRQGVASNILNEIDSILQLRNSYKESANIITDVNHYLDKKQQNLNNEIKVKEDALKNKERMLLNRFTKAQSQFDQNNAYYQLVEELFSQRSKND